MRDPFSGNATLTLPSLPIALDERHSNRSCTAGRRSRSLRRGGDSSPSPHSPGSWTRGNSQSTPHPSRTNCSAIFLKKKSAVVRTREVLGYVYYCRCRAYLHATITEAADRALATCDRRARRSSTCRPPPVQQPREYA